MDGDDDKINVKQNDIDDEEEKEINQAKNINKIQMGG